VEKGVCGRLGQTQKSEAKSPLDPGQPQSSNTIGNWHVRDFYETGARGEWRALFHQEIATVWAGGRHKWGWGEPQKSWAGGTRPTLRAGGQSAKRAMRVNQSTARMTMSPGKVGG
jgi:hypothetical protein